MFFFLPVCCVKKERLQYKKNTVLYVGSYVCETYIFTLRAEQVLQVFQNRLLEATRRSGEDDIIRIFISCVQHQTQLQSSKENTMGRACSTHSRDVYKIPLGRLGRRRKDTVK
jgi:hypothetical protein